VEVGEEDRSVLVGPDNGLLASAVAMVGGARRVVELTNEQYQLPAPGPTFAGRDVFGPAAAHLCRGVEMDELGRPVDPVTMIPGLLPVPREEEGAVVGEVLWVDRYGNAQLNVDPEELADMGEHISLRWAGGSRTAVRTEAFEGLGTGQLGLVVDSYGMLAVALDRRSAAEELELRPGDAVTLEGGG
jgi:S-adenosylmethionine hydrolase